MSFAWKQLQSAIRVLAATGDRRDRLAGAYSKLIKLKAKDLPSECADTFVRLTGRIARFPVKNISQEIRTEVQSLSDPQVAEAIESIMDMYDAVAAYQPRPAARAVGRPRSAAPAFDWTVPAMRMIEQRHFAQERAQ